MSDNKEPKKRRFIQIPQTKATVKRNILLAAGLLLIAIGLVIFISFKIAGNTSFPFMPSLFLLAGFTCFFLVFAVSKSSILFGFGIVLTAWGIISLLSDSGVVNFTKTQLWPIEGFAVAFAIFAAGIHHFHKIRSFFLFPSLGIAALSLLFTLFSMKIVDMPFTVFISIWWPVFFIVVGLLLIGLFLFQQKNQKDFPYMEDDSTDLVFDSQDEDDN